MYIEVTTVCGEIEKLFDIVKIEIIEEKVFDEVKSEIIADSILRFTEECGIFSEISRDKVQSVTADGSVIKF